MSSKEGKLYESNVVQPKLENLCKDSKFKFTRLYDTFSAGGRAHIPPQSCDFIVTNRNSISCFIEFKWTSSETKFDLNSLTKEQYRSYIESVEFGYTYVIVLYSKVHDCYYAVPSYWLRNLELTTKRASFNFLEKFGDWGYKTIDEFFPLLFTETFQGITQLWDSNTL